MLNSKQIINFCLSHSLKDRENQKSQYKRLFDEQHDREILLAQANKKVKLDFLPFANRNNFYKLADLKKKIDDKDDQIAELLKEQAAKKEQLDPLSTDNSSEIAKLKNEIARAEQSANLYFQMYEKERKINQV